MKKFENFSEWFDETLFNAEIIDTRYPLKGFAVYKAWGSRITRKIVEMLEEQLETTGHDPMLFPVTISEDSFAKEAHHIKGFTAEVFWITHAGNRKLQKRMLLRPTSETAMYPMFAYWIRSHADLPLRICQSVSVYRYETKATRPLLRMREFLWNEAHTAHRDWDEAEEQVKDAVKIYGNVFKRLGLSYYVLKRPDFDKFAGAVYSIAFDAWNPDGRVNQIGTVHNLGKNFAKAFKVTYEDTDGTHKHVTQTCYGFGISRTLAAVIAQHGDDHGVILSPEIAPVQVVVVPIPYKESENEVDAYASEVYEKIRNAGFRVHLDEEDKTPGEKYYRWEMLGVPVRVEVGPRDLKERCVTLSERVSLKRSTVAFDEVVLAVERLFAAVARNLKARSRSTLEDMTVDVNDVDSLKKAVRDKKIARVCWCEDAGCAETMKDESGGEIRGYRIDVEEKPELPCVICGRKAERVVYVARAY
ncbi:MAG: proline--tRNA ligase [Candidatus Bathyarchaeota archaeon]|nr:proline--tRNA ligase [Candidatus Bathyarchaeota archaeon]